MSKKPPKPPEDKYAIALNRQNIKGQLINRIAMDITFLATHFDGDKEVMNLVNSILPWFTEHGIIVIEDENEEENNVIDFQEYLAKKSQFNPK